MVTMTIMGVLLSCSAPKFHRAVEQSRADVAAGNLRSLWSSERLYRLDNPAYAASLGELVAAGLLEANFAAGGDPAPAYTYAVASSDAQGFAITATRAGGGWSGHLLIDQTGAVTGSITRTGEDDIAPGYL